MERVPSVLGRQGRVRGLLIAPVSPRLLTAANRIGSSRRSASAGDLSFITRRTGLHTCPPAGRGAGGRGAVSLVFRLELAQPCLNVRKKVRISAMGTTEWGDVTRQGGEALHVQINARVDLVSGCWANKFQWRHYKPSCLAQKKEAPTGGNRGFFWFLWGELVREGLPSRGVLARDRR